MRSNLAFKRDAISATEQNIHRLCHMKCWQHLLLLGIALWRTSAWACIEGDGSGAGYFDIFDILLLILEFSLVGFFLLFWWIKKKFWASTAVHLDKFLFYFCLFLATLVSVGLGVFGTFLISAFEDVYVSYGAELPNATRFLFSIRNFLWLNVVLVAVLGWASRNKPRRVFYSLILCNIELGIFIWVVWAFYRPIFKMGGLCG